MQNNNITEKIKVQGVKTRKIENDEYVKAIFQGRGYVDVIAKDRPTGATIKKLNKKEYVVMSTGEIKEYKPKTDNKEKQIKSLKETFTRLRRLIRANFTNGSKNQLFITLTYAENMTDEKQLMKDFERFFKRLRYKLKEHKLDYIAVAEPQERGAWHFHVMLKSDQKRLYIDNKTLSEIWGNGYTDTQRLKSDDVGSYYVAYFTDILTESKDARSEKKRKKGARLSMYPKGFKFYRTSRGIKKPDEVTLPYGVISKCGYKKTYETAFEIQRTDGHTTDILNRVQKETWKR